MVDSEFIPPLTTLGDQGNLRAALIRRVPYTFASSENPEAFVAMDGGTGSIPWALVWAGHIFYFDPNDLTSAHDGISTLVTQDGYRYKVDDVAGEPASVKSRSITAPPASPSFGDAYLVPTGASGAWALHPRNIAVWTARGWVYVPPRVGQLVFVEDEGGFYHYGTSGAWVAGIGGSALGPSTVRASSLIGGRTHWVVVNQTTNAPPGSPANGVAYIVGPSPTGAWAGQTGRIAVYEINAWAFYVPALGWTAFDQSNKTEFYYDAAWVPKSQAYGSVVTVSNTAGSSISSVGGSGYVFTTSPPSSGNNHAVDPMTIGIQAASAGQAFEIEYSVSFAPSSAGYIAVAAFLDSNSSASDWTATPSLLAANGTYYAVFKFFLTLPDAAPHTVRIRWVRSDTTTSALIGLYRRRLIARRIG